MNTLIGVAAIACYLLASFRLVSLVRNSSSTTGPTLLLLVGVALALHTVALYPMVVTDQGFNFSFFRVASLVFLVIGFLGLLTLLTRHPAHSLLALWFPLAALAIASSLLFATGYTPRHDLATGMATHIALSLLSLGLMTLAALQSVLLLAQMRQLKERRTSGIIEILPPLQTMEWLLFRILWAGFLCLSVALLLGGLYVEDLFAQHLAHKTAFSIAAWCVYAVLLWGSYQFGWRGRTAVKWTITGLSLLTLGFFGSKFVLEIILN